MVDIAFQVFCFIFVLLFCCCFLFVLFFVLLLLLLFFCCFFAVFSLFPCSHLVTNFYTLYW